MNITRACNFLLCFTIIIAMGDITKKWLTVIFLYVAFVWPIVTIIGVSNSVSDLSFKDDLRFFLPLSFGACLFLIFFYLYSNSYDVALEELNSKLET